MDRRFDALTAFLNARLSREGCHGLHLTIGLLLLIGATSLFVLIAVELGEGGTLTLLDARFSALLRTYHQPAAISAMMIISDLHSTVAISVLTLVLALYLFRLRHRCWLITVVLTVFGGMFLNIVLKNIFLRARPHFHDPILTLSSHSFPSGHTMAASCFYGVVAAFAFWKMREWPGRLMAITLAVFLVLLVGFSRIYLGAHHLSDVLAAILEGSAWLAFCLTAAHTICRARHRERPSSAVL